MNREFIASELVRIAKSLVARNIGEDIVPRMNFTKLYTRQWKANFLLMI
jgi:hypothetical protein